jgi:hypothetical protein
MSRSRVEDAVPPRRAVTREATLDSRQPDETALGPARRLAVRVLAVLALLAFNFMIVFVISDAASRVGGAEEGSEPPGSAEARIGAEHPGEAVHLAGATAALVMGVSGLAGLVARPQRAGSATHAGLGAAAWLFAAAVVGDPDNYGGQAGVVDLAFVVLAVPALATALVAAPWRTWRRGRGRPAFLVAALIGLPWLWYGVGQGLMQRHSWPPLSDPHHQAHWFTMSLVAGLILLLVAGAALPGRGWRVAGSTAGASAVVMAVVSLVSLEAASSLRTAWAIGALAWGLGVLVLTWRPPRARRNDTTSLSY